MPLATQPGNNLGLSLVRAVADTHGAHIALTSPGLNIQFKQPNTPLDKSSVHSDPLGAAYACCIVTSVCPKSTLRDSSEATLPVLIVFASS